MDWDVFISHAWEDKDSFARPLAKALQTRGLKVWFDEFSLTIGDSLHRSIDYGLANSRYGIVILSPNFFAKEWPQKELDGLVSRETSGEKVILPIWHNITADQIRRYSPTLADRVAIISNHQLEDVVIALLSVIEKSTSASDRLQPKPRVVSPTSKRVKLRQLKWWEVISFIIAILSCLATWLALPQVQGLFAGINIPKVIPSLTLTLMPYTPTLPIAQLPTPTFTGIPRDTITPVPPVPTPTQTPGPIPTNTAVAPTSTSTPKPTGHIVFMSERDGNPAIYVMNVDGSGVTRLTDGTVGDYNPVWSPDSRRIVFVSDRNGNSEIYVMNADGSGQTNLTNHSNHDSQPAWSPDGQYIVFFSNRDGNFEIYTMKADGSEQTRLTNHPAEDYKPKWLSDGHIAFISRRNGENEIYVMNNDGSEQVKLTSPLVNELYTVWSPDGRYIAFESDRDGNSEIYIKNANGTNQINLTNNPAGDYSPSWSS